MSLPEPLSALLPPGLSFRDPWLLLLLLLVPVAIALRVVRERRGDGALVVPTLAFVAHVRPTWRVRRFGWLVSCTTCSPTSRCRRPCSP